MSVTLANVEKVPAPHGLHGATTSVTADDPCRNIRGAQQGSNRTGVMATETLLTIKQEAVEIRDRARLETVTKRLAAKPLLHGSQAVTVAGQRAQPVCQSPQTRQASSERKFPLNGDRRATSPILPVTTSQHPECTALTGRRADKKLPFPIHPLVRCSGTRLSIPGNRPCRRGFDDPPLSDLYSGG